MSPDEIEDVARRKVRGYLEDLIIQLSVIASNNPEKMLKDIEMEAFEKCNYGDPTIDKNIYAQIQDAIKRNLDGVFKSIAKKADRKFDHL